MSALIMLKSFMYIHPPLNPVKLIFELVKSVKKTILTYNDERFLFINLGKEIKH